MKNIVLSFLLLVAVFSSSSAQEKAPSPSRFEVAQNRIVALEIKEAEIRDVLRMLAEQFGLNIVISDRVSGKISVKFTNVSVEEAIDAIVTINGYAYTKKGNVIKVTTPEEVEREAPITRVFVLNNAIAEDLKPSLEKSLSSIGTIEVDKRSNALVVTDVPNSVQTIENLIKQLDKETPQVLIEARIIETILGNSKDLGINWTAKVTATGSKRPHTFPFRKVGPKSFFPENQTETSSDDEDTADFPYPHGFPYATTDEFSFGTLNFSQFQVVLEALQSSSETKVLSHPRLVTLNNQEAKILVGTRVPIPIYTFNDETGTYEISGYEEEDVGISLEVTPHVSPDNKIKLTLHPEVSSITGYTGPNDERPIIDTREASTQVQLRDGETVVIGGLIKQNKIDTVSKVPVLGDLPLLGLVFRHKSKSLESTDLLIFVTAKILKPGEKRKKHVLEIKKLFKPEKELE
ncbi:MAG: type IV pilus secretin PilQ [Candidatus Omnitrophica bacterium]|nr:type IV pilus secretin PilQ [Candidatus Omnitrophota bacterium]